MALNLKHQTQAQFLARLRERYQSATGEEAARLADWIAAAMDRGDLDDAELRNAWGKSVAGWAQVKNRMRSIADARRAAKSARGE